MPRNGSGICLENRMNYRYLLLSGCLVLLAACSVPQAQKPSEWQAERSLKTFATSGRMGVKVKEKGSYAHFDWTLENGVETVDVNTPLGSTVGQLCRDDLGVLAVDSKGQKFEAATPDELSEQLLGYRLPIAHLAVWANGEWVNGQPHRIETDGTLVQAGWRIRRSLNEDGSPRVLVLDNGQLNLRLVFSDSSREHGRADTQGRCRARA